MTAIDPVTQDVHDSAAAVLSRSFSFVEWKHVMAGSDPLALGETGAVPYQALFPAGGKGERWIYVFRRTSDNDPFDLKEEIRVSANGEMAATLAEDLSKDVKARRSPQALGKTMALPRRRFGEPLEYRFYASRVQLPLALMKALAGQDKDSKTPGRLRIDTFAPRVFLDPGKNDSVFENAGKMLVPVVDPITIALHLHAAYVAAADDLVNYTTPHAGLDQARRTRVERRRKKHLLAAILKGLLEQEATNGGKDLITQIGFDGKNAIDTFIAGYAEEVRWRIQHRDLLAGFLTRWLASPAISVAAAAHKARGAWAQFFVPWCRALAQLGDSPQGRAFLAGLFDKSDHFANTYLWPSQAPTDDYVQMVRKSSLTVLEAFKVYAEARIVNVRWGAKAEDIVAKLQTLTGLKQGSLKIEPIHKTVAGKPVDYRAVAFSVSYDVGGNAKLAASLKGAVESINLVIALWSAKDQLKSASPRERELALIGLIGSTLDASSALASLVKNGAKVAAVLGFVSGVIDIYLGVQDQKKQLAAGNQGGADGAFLTAAGATIGTAGTLLTLLAVPGANIVAAIGLATVAIGFIYKLVKGRSALEIFFAHCTWGKDRTGGTPDWSPVNYKDWHGDKGYDHQLQALLNIICAFEIGHDGNYRHLTLKLGWVPDGAQLRVTYQETWEKIGPKKIDGAVTFTGGSPQTTGPIKASMKSANVLAVVVDSPVFPGQKPSTIVPRTSPGGGVRVAPASGLKQADAEARLHVTFDHTAALSIPGGKPIRSVFHS